jgi:4-hydroxybenzoate polyprenyltransferase
MKRFLPYLQLMRLPALFTALTDTFAGLMMNHSSLAPASDFVWLLLATTGLYLSGMVFNDVFDVKQDREERPGRPIPSGRVPLSHAVALGAVLMGCGLGSAALVRFHSFLLASLLAGCILAYDGLLKKTWLGPLAMGGCRLLNILLAASAGVAVVAPWQGTFQRPQLGLAAGIGLYIVGLTLFARTEAQSKSRARQLVAGILIGNTGIAVLMWLVWVWPGDIAITRQQILIALAIAALILNRRWFLAVAHPEPAQVQAGIKIGLLSLIVLDAIMIIWKTGDLNYALITLAALIPAMFLSKLIPMT